MFHAVRNYHCDRSSETFRYHINNRHHRCVLNTLSIIAVATYLANLISTEEYFERWSIIKQQHCPVVLISALANCQASSCCCWSMLLVTVIWSWFPWWLFSWILMLDRECRRSAGENQMSWFIFYRLISERNIWTEKERRVASSD